MTVRTLFIGMDGATFTVLDDLTSKTDPASSVMPFLSKIFAEGTRAKLRSTPNPLTPPAWVSLMTGRSPGNHGVYDFIRAEERNNDVFFTLYDSRDCRVETIWSIASRQGKKVAALNFPFTAPPPKDLNGFMVPGFVPWRHLRRNSTPSDLYDRLKQIPDFNPQELAWDFEQEKQAMNELTDNDRENWVRYHLPREKQWFRIADYLLREEAPDLMAVMFDGVDKLQHQAWAYVDPALQKGELSEYHQRMRVLCMDYFRQLDSFIEKLVTAAGPEVQVFMASDHGFTASTEVLRINAYLHEKGWLKWREVPDTEAGKRREDSMFAFLDWQETIAYCRTPSSNGINIRVARNPGDTGIKPEDYDSVRTRLIRDLEDLKDPVTGDRIITEIHTRDKVFPGEAMADAPDLLLTLRDHGFVSIKNKLPIVEPRPEVVGTHHPDGVFLAYGPGINAGAQIARRNITDVGATLLYSLGLQVPSDFEGKVPASMFTQPQLDAHPIVIGAATTAGAGKADPSDGMADDEKEKILAQLQMLGYME
ncbi:alkaline phosphatase family protein [Aquabacterium sp.]|uniref:alkaline phosphatase family protein n=1 Tax=Aquabacterium sp. TaxID=1872578 RepID=UPI002BF17C60|nr:alkaline phosphatase family protein [Aquabacterium sp.]HSW05870.1 alkaline phosphatase family protein [Aquabacterium sp.]